MPLWKASMLVTANAVKAFDAALADSLVDTGAVVSARETRAGGPWQCEVVGGEASAGLEGELDEGVLATAIAEAAAAAGIEIPRWGVEELPDRDWVAENQRSFRPFNVGPFYIHPSHEADKVPANAIAIQIDAGMAFGTGTHATTRGCLTAIAKLDPQKARNPADVGTGSGILAIAMAKLWERPVLATDNDRDAIDVARQNAAINDVADRISVMPADGLRAPDVMARQPFDLVVANILSGPLVELAPGIGAAAAQSATVILSGLMADQQNQVVAAYAEQGFRLADVLAEEEWRTLVLER
jgi:ribosomal protein L11 methyltransferase